MQRILWDVAQYSPTNPAGVASSPAEMQRKQQRVLEYHDQMTDWAPRDNASKPRAPVPANRSSTCISTISDCSQLNRVSRVRSPVGRSPDNAGMGNFRPRCTPPMMRSVLSAIGLAERCGNLAKGKLSHFINRRQRQGRQPFGLVDKKTQW